MNEKSIDPVCGMQVDTQTARFISEHNGARYYFCAAGCLRRFDEHPQQYIGGEVAPSPPVVADAYTCPMHPQVIQNNPGPCPLCGMLLEPVAAGAGADGADDELRDMSLRFWLSLAFTLPVMLCSMGTMLRSDPPTSADTFLLWLQQTGFFNNSLSEWLQLVCTSFVIGWCALPIWQRFGLSLRNRSLNMFTLIGFGTAIAYLFSLFAFFCGKAFMPMNFWSNGAPPLYFETAAAITTLVLLGQVLELRARSQAGNSLKALLNLQPSTCRRIDASGGESDVSVSAIAAGDKLRVLPGKRVPVDGEVVEGSSAVDESMITGEAIPVGKQMGDRVIAGTLNGTGSFVMVAMQVGEQTLLSQIVRMVNDAQRSQAPVQRVADRVSAFFVPFVLAVAVLTFVGWLMVGTAPALMYAITCAVSVLVIACPCALGLATPMSIMVAAGRGAHAGVLIKDAAALETLRKVRVLALDKTGTLTEGAPSVVHIYPHEEFDEDAVLAVAASLELHSEHPLSKAVMSYAEKMNLKVEPSSDFQYRVGKGLTGRVGGHQSVAGTEDFLSESGVPLPDGLAQRALNLRSQGNSVLWVAKNGRVAGLIAVADPIRASSREALEKLRRSGIETVMITGDSKVTARAVGKELGFKDEQIFAAVPLDKKADVIDALKSSGKAVAMAGDGINDAVALARADVAIAMGGGSDVALENADLALVKGDMGAIVRAFNLSRATMRNIYENLFFAFVYNAVGIFLATGILYPSFGILLNPMIAAAAMSFSSICVVMNSLRLRAVCL